jgi:hypothetical protein
MSLLVMVNVPFTETSKPMNAFITNMNFGTLIIVDSEAMVKETQRVIRKKRVNAFITNMNFDTKIIVDSETTVKETQSAKGKNYEI